MIPVPVTGFSLKQKSKKDLPNRNTDSYSYLYTWCIVLVGHSRAMGRTLGSVWFPLLSFCSLMVS